MISIIRKIIIISLIILLGIYFFMPNLLTKYFFNYNNTIDIEKYVLTPDPSKLFFEGLKISTSKVYEFNGLATAADLYFQSIKLFNVNVITLLDETNDKKIVLETYLIQLNDSLNNIDNTISNLESIYLEEENLSNTYLQEKEQGDSMFNQGLVEKDTNILLEGFKKSYDNGPKYQKHRILANASKILVMKLKSIRNLISLKIQLLEANQTEIIENFDLIKGDLLPKLLELKKRLENNYVY